MCVGGGVRTEPVEVCECSTPQSVGAIWAEGSLLDQQQREPAGSHQPTGGVMGVPRQLRPSPPGPLGSASLTCHAQIQLSLQFTLWPFAAMLQADDEDDMLEMQMKSPFGSSFRTFNATDYKPIGKTYGLLLIQDLDCPDQTHRIKT